MSWRRVLVVLMGLLPATMQGQTLTLSVTGASTAMQNPTLADYDAGFVTDATAATYTATLSNGRNNCTYSTKVQVRAAASTIGNTKSVSTVSWSTGGTYTTLTTSWVDVATHNLTRATGQSTANIGSGSLTFRITLAWTETAASYAGAGLDFQAVVTPSGSGC